MQGHLYGYIAQLQSSLQVENFQTLRERVAVVSESYEERIAELYQALTLPDLPLVEIDQPSEYSRSVFVKREAEKLKGHMQKLASKLYAPQDTPRPENPRFPPNMPIAKPMKEEEMENESPSKRARRHKASSVETLPAINISQQAVKAGQASLAMPGRAGRNHSNVSNVSDCVSSVSALKKKFEAPRSPIRAVPVNTSSVSDKIQMFGGKSKRNTIEAPLDTQVEAAPSLSRSAACRMRSIDALCMVPPPAPSAPHIGVDSTVALAERPEVATSSEAAPCAEEGDAAMSSREVSSNPEAIMATVDTAVGVAEMDMPWVVMPRQPAVLLRSVEGSRSAPAFSNIVKSNSSLLQANARPMDVRRAEGQASSITDSCGKGKNKSQRRSATFVVPKEGVLYRKLEEQRARGKQERERTKSPKVVGAVRGASPLPSAHVTSGTSTPIGGAGVAFEALPSPAVVAAAPAKGKGKGKTHRRSATFGAGLEVGAIAVDDACTTHDERTSDNAGLTSLLSEQVSDGARIQSPICTPRKIFPAVPQFKEEQEKLVLEPWEILRQAELPPPKPEENYEISDQGDSDPDDVAEARRRAKKPVPRWCENYLERLSKQIETDPDSLFGTKVPVCRLEDIFPACIYEQSGKSRPKRTRGSSQDWKRDRLTKEEVNQYKKKMGQTKGWFANLENMPPANQHLLAGPRRAA
jgi:hypothetical protein